MTRFCAVPFLLALAAAPALAADPPAPLVKEKEIVLPGGPFCDLMAVEPTSHRVFLAHSPGIDVIDVEKGERVGVVDGVERAHGVVVVPEAKRGFATAGASKQLVVFDLASFKAERTIETGENPDALLYVSATKEVWSFNGKSKNVTCVDATSLETKSTISLDGKPELAVEDAATGHVYVNLEDKSVVTVIESKTHKVVETHPLAPGEEPSGLAIDTKSGLLFAGCGNKKLVIVSTASWEVVATVDIGEHCDGVVFDAASGNAYASCRDGTSVVHEKDAKTFEALAPLETPGGRTCVFDSGARRLLVSSSPKRGEKGAVKLYAFVAARTPK